MKKTIYNIRRNCALWLLGFHECPVFLRKSWKRQIDLALVSIFLTLGSVSFFVWLFINFC